MHGAKKGQAPEITPTNRLRQTKGINREADTKRTKGVRPPIGGNLEMQLLIRNQVEIDVSDRQSPMETHKHPVRVNSQYPLKTISLNLF